jgi:putative SOS response-associated peptidase YedK
MCGRITLTRPNLESIAAELNVEPMSYRGYPLVEPHYNIAPTSILPILTLENGQREISPMTWGVTLGTKRSFVINLRAETAAPREAFRKHRCGVITDGFYEWTAVRAPTEVLSPDREAVAIHGKLLLSQYRWYGKFHSRRAFAQVRATPHCRGWNAPASMRSWPATWA